jgi:hypothetical protein
MADVELLLQVDSAGGTIFCAEWAVLVTESRSHPGPPIGRQPGGEGERGE